MQTLAEEVPMGNVESRKTQIDLYFSGITLYSWDQQPNWKCEMTMKKNFYIINKKKIIYKRRDKMG